MKNIHLLPTEKPSRLFKFANQLHLDTIPKDYYKKYNIYITSDEEIKEGDWYYWIVTNMRIKAIRDNLGRLPKFGDGSRKIIITTDADLIKDGVQAIDDEFLEWFVKNPSCKFVEVGLIEDSEDHPELVGNPREEWSYYEIIIPQEEPNPFEYTNTNNFTSMIYNPQEEPKQETLEEAAEEFAKNYSIYPTAQDDTEYGFKHGAKWQSERMYSKEDMREAFKANYTPFSATNIGDVEQDFQKWFEQFKKKD